MLNRPPDSAEEYKPAFLPAVDSFKIIQKFLFILKEKEDQQRFEYLCKYISASMDCENTKFAYISVALSKNYVLPWIQQLKDVLWLCCQYISNLKLEVSSDMRMITTCLRMLITFTSTSGWKIFKGKNGEALRPGMNQLCSNVMGHVNNKGLYPALQVLLMKGLARCKPVFKSVTLSAIITISIRPLVAAQFSDKLLSLFMLHVLSVPGLILHISNLTPECLAILMTHRIFRKCIDLLSNEQSTKIIFNTLEGNYALCLLANLIQLGDSEMEFVVTRLLENCQRYVLSKRSNMPHWHPVLGWFSQKTDQSLHEAMPFVVKQLQLLWKIKMIKILFSDLISHNEINEKVKEMSRSSPTKNPFKKAFEKASSKQTTVKINLDSPLMMSTFSACALFRHH